MIFDWVRRRAAQNSSAGRRGKLVRPLRTGDGRQPGRLHDLPLDPRGRADRTGEKRERERVPLAGRVSGEVMVFQPMTLLDMSQAGVQIETNFVLPVYSLHDFRLSLGDRSIIVKGRIAYCHIGELTDTGARYRAGVAFVDVSERALSAIVDFVSAIRYSRSGGVAASGGARSAGGG